MKFESKYFFTISFLAVYFSLTSCQKKSSNSTETMESRISNNNQSSENELSASLSAPPFEEPEPDNKPRPINPKPPGGSTGSNNSGTNGSSGSSSGGGSQNPPPTSGTNSSGQSSGGAVTGGASGGGLGGQIGNIKRCPIPSTCEKGCGNSDLEVARLFIKLYSNNPLQNSFASITISSQPVGQCSSNDDVISCSVELKNFYDDENLLRVKAEYSSPDVNGSLILPKGQNAVILQVWEESKNKVECSLISVADGLKYVLDPTSKIKHFFKGNPAYFLPKGNYDNKLCFENSGGYGGGGINVGFYEFLGGWKSKDKETKIPNNCQVKPIN